jgi:hypothetical protein
MRLIVLAVIVSLSLFTAPIAGRAQPASKIPRVAFLTTTSREDTPNPGVEGLRQQLRELGYIEGQIIAIDCRWGAREDRTVPGVRRGGSAAED